MRFQRAKSSYIPVRTARTVVGHEWDDGARGQRHRVEHEAAVADQHEKT
jgi:hypothetical protein